VRYDELSMKVDSRGERRRKKSKTKEEDEGGEKKGRKFVNYFSGGRATRDVNIDWDDTIASSHDGVGVVIVAASVGATAHRDDVAWIGHLVVNLSESGGHLVR